MQEDQEDNPKQRSRTLRCLVAFWIFGLCNNYGFVVMLTAAADIIGETGGERSKNRDCTYMSTGAILLADILPSSVAKTTEHLLKLLLLLLHFSSRIILCILLGAVGFLCVALSQNMVIALLGVGATSIASGLGEVTYLQYSNFYFKNVISTWSSGTGGAGIFGAGSYALLQYIGFRTALLIMLLIPAMMALTFFVILPKPEATESVTIQENFNLAEVKSPKEIIIKKIKLIPDSLKYMVPFTLVYIFQYYINQGTFELVNFKNTFVSLDDQYRWLQVDYQIGNFISRSSVNLIHIKKIWLLAIFQAINVVIFTTEVIYYYVPYFWIMILLTLWEGLIAGATYVNTFYRIAHEVEEEDKQFSMAITTFCDSIGITTAGIAAIYVHNAICDMPMPTRAY